ncbi:hypothetical protein [Fictibacillus terranigra]|uniref:DUF3592 domain-containing protein n=1 Tax=Fictibacillus terranigra TaxID=3058424 RepID=A0ABT8EAF8_9BACL|nr:hypothetical protein [Fictibacillus sp. CENA-BCM004]MDN4074886.1 hypothetical protein [Fictibacillus sp. CENA-BCM004]
MKVLKNVSVMLAGLFVFQMLLSSAAFAKWAYPFVVWDHYTYSISDEYVDQADKEIGHVTHYSDQEGTYSGNFSNEYKKGTKYFSIHGISTDKAIAVQEPEGKYRKAIREHKYNTNKAANVMEQADTNPWMSVLVLAGAAAVLLVSYQSLKSRFNREK